MVRRRSARLTKEEAVPQQQPVVEPVTQPNTGGAPENVHTEDPFRFLDTVRHPLEDEGGACELHTYEVRTNSKGDQIFLQIGRNDEFFDDHKGRSRQAALVLKRIYNPHKSIQSIQLEIQSPHIKKALREVVRSYPGVNIDSDAHIFLFDEPRCLFHYREELKAYASASDSEEAQKHITFCLQYMARVLKRQLSSYNHMMRENSAPPGLEFGILWMAFKPGDLLFRKVDGVETVVRLVRMVGKVEKNETTRSARRGWDLCTQRLQWNGTELGFVERPVYISEFDGHKPLTDLPIYPLHYHRESERIKAELYQRGKEFLSLLGVHHREYNGVAELLVDKEYCYTPVKNRIIIDAKEFNNNIFTTYTKFMAGARTLQPESDGEFHLTDEELLLCHHKLPGFSLFHKRWALFHVNKIREVQYSTKAFDDLAMPQQKKALISSLVKTHEDNTLDFDDIIKGKGRGLIFLLHGPPGVGKTLTAESIADRTQRPLYVLGSGDLGAFGSRVEKHLSRAMHLATKWNAVLLIDEADVFMEERKDNEILRNELVSILLRSLEYYEGVLFLTTNRMGSIDSAFKSRIHLSLSFPPLSAQYRRQLWKRFLLPESEKPRPRFLAEKYLDKLSKEELNGRQIKNIVRVAFALATSADRPLEPGDILEGLQSLKSFEKDFSEAQAKRKRAISQTGEEGKIMGEEGVQEAPRKKQFHGLFQ